MSAPDLEAIKAVRALLLADAALAAAFSADCVHMTWVRGEYPALSITTGEARISAPQCFDIAEFSLHVDIWARDGGNPPGEVFARNWGEAIRRMLSRKTLTLESWRTSGLIARSVRSVPDLNNNIRRVRVSFDAHLARRP